MVTDQYQYLLPESEVMAHPNPEPPDGSLYPEALYWVMRPLIQEGLLVTQIEDYCGGIMFHLTSQIPEGMRRSLGLQLHNFLLQ